jgi:uncharacterized protein (DUF1697 family)
MTYVTLLRGINVSGKHLIKMEQLRRSMEALGFERVETYVQSGNIVFDAKEKSAAAVAKKISARLYDEYGYTVSVLVKTADELTETMKKNGFLKQKGVDPATLHVTFLYGAPGKAGLAKIAAIAAGADRFLAVDQQIYLFCPDGYGRTKLSNVALERALGLCGTTRNWRTVTMLVQMIEARKVASSRP